MTYTEFTDYFLPTLAISYRSGKFNFHALVDFDLWKKVFPDEGNRNDEVQWSEISFNAFTLNDKEKSLFVVFAMPERIVPNEAKFVGFRLDNNRKRIACYSLRRPKYHDDPWKVFLYDYKDKKNFFITELMGTHSMREFINAVEKIDFQDCPSLVDKILTMVQS